VGSQSPAPARAKAIFRRKVGWGDAVRKITGASAEKPTAIQVGFSGNAGDMGIAVQKASYLCQLQQDDYSDGSGHFFLGFVHNHDW
jgi:hypothetical protein